jgi:hypothetical protein
MSPGFVQLFHDRARLTTSESMDVDRRLRCMFYVLSVMAESEATRRHGFVILSVVGKNTRKGTLEINTNTRGLALLRSEVTLARVVAGHLVVMENRPLLTTFASLIVGVAERLKVLRKGEIVVHNGPSDSDSLVKKLQAHGFDMEGIPTVPFGGLFSFGCFKAWVEDRIRLETAGPGAGVAVSETDPTLAEEDEKRKKKRIDAAYCRRKRFRKKIEVEVMQAEVERLQQQNERLREQGNALEGSIQEARNAVEAHKRKEQEEACLPSESLAPQGHPPPSNAPRANMSFSDALRSAIRAQRGPLDFTLAQPSSEVTHPHQFSAASLIGARNSRFPSATHGQLQDAAYLLNASHAGMADLSRFGQQRTAMDQVPTRSHADSLRLSDLVSEATLSSLLHQQQHLQNYQSRPSAVAYTGVSDPRRNHLAAAQAAAAADLQRDGLDRLDPYELALLQLYGGLGGPPRLI